MHVFSRHLLQIVGLKPYCKSKLKVVKKVLTKSLSTNTGDSHQKMHCWW
jgi:hypothetical protein